MLTFNKLIFCNISVVLILFVMDVQNFALREENDSIFGMKQNYLIHPPPFEEQRDVGEQMEILRQQKLENPKFEDAESNEDGNDKPNAEQTRMESWCIIWYLGAFGSLVCFFMVITCTELCVSNPLYGEQNLTAHVKNMAPASPATPPPPYHLFAPPEYNDNVLKNASKKRELLCVYVVPVQGASLVPSPTLPPIRNQETGK